MPRVDYIRECNEHAIPTGDFEAAFCGRCFQPECGRSQYGKSKFDQRVASWADRLFLNVPKLDPNDPRYAPLSSQKFLTIDTGRTPEIRSTWVDPNEPEAPAPQPPIMTAAPPETPAPPPEVTGGVLPRRVLLANAPSQAGKVLGSSGQPVRKDPWATPEPPADPVVAPGSRIKIGGSGV